MREGPQDDPALEREIPIFEILDVARDPVLDIGTVARFAAKSAHLGQAGNARFHKCADMIIPQELRELLIVFDQVRSRADDAHVAAQNVPELRHFVDA